MTPDKSVPNGGPGGSSSNAPDSAPGGKATGKNNRRRALRNKRRSRKPNETPETRPAREPREAPAPARPVDKTTRENRERRRRRRMRTKQRGQADAAPQVVEDALKDLPPLVPAFVYTHVIRPMVRDSYEFRTEHFSKVTRRLEDFHIDLSPLYPEGGDEIKSATYVPPLPAGEEDGEDGENWQDEGEEYHPEADARTAAEESLDAARLDGATAEDLGLVAEADALFGEEGLDDDAGMDDEGWDPDEGDDLDALA